MNTFKKTGWKKGIKEELAADICDIILKGKVERGNISNWVYKKGKDVLKIKNNVLKCA